MLDQIPWKVLIIVVGHHFVPGGVKNSPPGARKNL